jgi:hypothetical protein
VALVAPGLRDDEAQIGVDHPLLGLEVTALDALGQLDLFRRCEQRVYARPAQEKLERLGGADALQLCSLQTVSGMRAAAPVLPAISLGRVGPERPLGLVWVDFVIATDALSAVAMGVITLQFLSPLIDKVRCTSNYSIVRCPSNLGLAQDFRDSRLGG